MRAALLLLPLALSTACLRQTEFNCSLNSQCNPGGVCQTSVGFCSFADSACSSGQRFGDSAGSYSGQCVGGQSGGDGGGIDSPDAMAVGCPADYAAITGGTAGRVYKKAPNNVNWTGQFDYCQGTSARAYLAVPNDAGELTALHTLAGATFWVGINDRVTEGTFVQAETGGVPGFLPWAANEPDNPGGQDGQDCVAATDTTISTEECTGGGSQRPGVCECMP
jgi:hypothetical protein